MDKILFSKILSTIAKYTHSCIWFRKEQLYYYEYIHKLSYHIKYSEIRSVDQAISYVGAFEYKQSKRIKNGLFVKPRKMLFLACKDTTDVLESMRRYDGVGVENWKAFDVFSEVNFGSC